MLVLILTFRHIFLLFQPHLQDPQVFELKKEGDEKFKAKQYQEAAAFYTMAMNCPIVPFMDVSVIAEKLLRNRAVSFFKMVTSFPRFYDGGINI